MTTKTEEIAGGIIDAIDGIRDPVKSAKDDLGPPAGWPRMVWVLCYSSGEHGCMHYNKVYALASFKKRVNCVEYAKFVKNPPSRAWLARSMSFEDARTLAKKKALDEAAAKNPQAITAMILADSPTPLVFFVN